MDSGVARGLAAVLKDLESPLDEVRMRALRELDEIPSLAGLRAIRRIAVADSNPSLRMEARRRLAAFSSDLKLEQLPEQAGARSTADRLQSMLADPDPATRARVVRHLTTLLDPAVPRLLAAALEREEDPFVVCALLQALASTQGPEAAPGVKKYLSSADPRVRATAVEALAATGDADAVRGLIPMLQDVHDRVRVAAARALQAQEREAVLEAIDQMLASQHDLSVRSALYVLRCWEDELSLPRLREGLGSASAAARAMALESLNFRSGRGSRAARELASQGVVDSALEDGCAETESTAKPAPVEARIEDGLANAEPQERVGALLRAVRQGRTELLGNILRLLETERHPRVLATAVSAVGRLGAAADASALSSYLEHEEPRIRANAVEAVGLLDARGNLAGLSRSLADPNNRVRANAVMALARVEGSGALEVLEAMAHSHNSRFQISAVYAAAAIATPPAVALLVGLLDSDDSGIRGRVRSALESLAPVVPAAADALRQDSNESAPQPPAPVLPDETIQRLLFNLEHESPVVRLRTLQAISAKPDRRLLAGARRLLKDDDSAVRHAALQTVHAMLRRVSASPEASAAALAQLQARVQGGPEQILGALQEVVEVTLAAGAEPVAGLLMRLLPGEKEPTVRASLVSALSLVGGSAAVALYRGLLRDPDARVRANAIDAIELAGNDTDLLATAACLADPSPRVRGAAIRACMSVSKDRFLSHLQGMLAAEAVADRAAALHVARTLQFPERFDFLVAHFLAESHPRLSEASAAALATEAEAGRREDVLRLAEQLPPGARRKCLRAALGLPQDGAESSVAATLTAVEAGPLDLEATGSFELVAGLEKQGLLTPGVVRQKLAAHSDPLTTVTLLRAVRDLRLEDAFDLAQPFTYARDRRVRLAAIQTLARLDDPRVRAALWSLVKDRDAEVSRSALDALRAAAPEAAFHAACSLLEMSQPASVRRGLELLDEMGESAALTAILELLRRRTHASFVEPPTKLVLRWGDAGTLDQLSEIYRTVEANSRPFVAELASALAAQLGVTHEELGAKFPSRVAAAAVASPAPGPVAPHRSHEPQSATGAALALATLVYFSIVGTFIWMLLPADEAVAFSAASLQGRSGQPSQSEPAMQFGTRAPAGPSMDGGPQLSFQSILRDALSENLTPTLQDVEHRLREQLASSGIHSQAFVHVLALERVENAYQFQMSQADLAVKQGKYDLAVRLLEALIAEVDPDHLTARMEILAALEQACRLAGRPGEAAAWENQRLAAEGRLMELCLEAGRQSGIPEQRLQTFRQTIEKRATERSRGREALRLFSRGELGGP